MIETDDGDAMADMRFLAGTKRNSTACRMCSSCRYAALFSILPLALLHHFLLHTSFSLF